MVDSSSNDEGVVGNALETAEPQMGELIQESRKQADCDAENDGKNSNKMNEIGTNIDDEEQNGQETFLAKQVVRGVASQPQQQDYPEPSTPPPPLAPPPMENVVEDCGNTADTQQSLEERVQELETKLATLSLLLHQQRAQMMKGRTTSAISPTLTPPASPQNDTTRAAPALDSPAEHFRLSREERRQHNLSFRLLYQDADFPEPPEDGFAKRNSSDDENDHVGRPLTEQEGLLEIKVNSLQVPENFGQETVNGKRRSYGHDDGNAPYPLSPSPVFLRKLSESMKPIEESPILPKTSMEDLTGRDSNSVLTDLSASTAPTGANMKSRAIHMFPPDLPLERSSKQDFKSFDEAAVDDAGRRAQNTETTETASTANKSATTPTKPSESSMADESSKEAVSRPRSASTTAPPKSKSAVATENWLNYLNSFQESNHDVDKQMEEFVMVPSAVESLLSFGFWICVDSFLYSLTILPIRAIWSCVLLFRYVALRLTVYYGTNNEVPDGPYRFHRRHSYQLIQVGIIYTVYKYALMAVSIGKLYHWIRGQSMIKLYVLIAIVEVFDRLMCSLGQDCLDSLYWNTTRRPRSSRMIVAAIVVLLYAIVHSFLLFVHVSTLNVAMNSADQALLTLLISGNFAEIKSTVFKKYNKPNLFKIAASDICERFKLALFLGLVLTLNMSQGMDKAMVLSYCQMCGIVWCAEWLADWIKHSFITKFNYISSNIYPQYALLLAGDVTGIGHEGVNLDHSHAVVKRIGFAQIPLVCVMFRYVREAVKYASDAEFYFQVPVWATILAAILFWFALLLLKVFLGDLLHRMSKKKLEAAPELSKSTSSLQSVGSEKKKN